MSATALRLQSVEWLAFAPMQPRGAEMCAALQGAAASLGIRVTATTQYRGTSDVLCLWGPGAPNRWPAMRAQFEAGSTTVAWDLAYFDRHHKIRCAINGAHPAAWVMRKDWPGDRFLATGLPIESTWDPDGPVLVAGIGPKATVQYGADRVHDWEIATIADLRARGRAVLYRRKNNVGWAPPGILTRYSPSVAGALRGCSLCVTWHSNVAIDAIRLGIPVVCQDGAAAAICPSIPAADPQPVAPELRRRFLHNLAYFEWAPSEVVAFWRFLEKLLA
jgi:hypothetical protein